MPGLQSSRVQRVPGVPEADPRLEVHRVLRGQVRTGGGGAYADGRDGGARMARRPGGIRSRTNNQ